MMIMGRIEGVRNTNTSESDGGE